jgi:hypothetical protein
MQIERTVPAPYVFYSKKGVSDSCDIGFVEKFYSKNDIRTGILEFQVDGNAEHLILPSKIFLKLGLELNGKSISVDPVTKIATEVKLKDGAKCSVVNNIFGSIFESVEVYVSNQSITKSDKHNPYNTYLQTLCNYGEDSLKTYFELSGWAKDTAAHMDDVSQDNNEGLKTRRAMFRGTPLKGEFIGKLCSPIFFQHKALPSQISLRIVLRKAKDEFLLMHEAGEFELKITDAVLMVQKVGITPILKEGYMKMLEEDHPIPYFLTTPSVNYYSIELGASQFMRDDLFLGKMPRRIVVGMVETDAYHGKKDKNPFNFQDFGLIEIAMYKDGIPYPRPVLKLDMATSECAEAYHNFMSSLNGAYSRNVPMLTLADYKKGFTLFSFDMSPDQMGSIHPGSLLNMNSNIRLEMKFKTALRKNVTLLVYSEIEHLMEIHRDRRVSIDF